VSVRVEPARVGESPGRSQLEARLRAEGLTPQGWANGPGDRYGWHRHDYHKVLYCVSGSIVFHTADGDVELQSGDRLDVEPGTDHAATVGPDGVECIEAARPSSA
jgi:quercetin dioxygenase-like cupin family protein